MDDKTEQSTKFDEEHHAIMNKSRIQQSLPPEYFEKMNKLLSQIWPTGINLSEILKANEKD